MRLLSRFEGLILSLGGTLLLLVAAAGCTNAVLARGPAGDLRISAVSDLEEVAADTLPSPENEIYSQAQGQVHLGGAIQEVVSFQVVAAATRSPATITSVKMDDFRGPAGSIPAEHIRIYRQARITADTYPSWYLRLTPNSQEVRQIPDLLIPITAPKGALPIPISPGRCEALWVDIEIPPGTPAGAYSSSLKLQLTGGSARDLPVSLEVWPFALPQTRHLALLAGVDSAPLLKQHVEVSGKPYAPAHLSIDDPAFKSAASVFDDTLRLLHDHRCSPILKDVHPRRKLGPTGQMELDWADYDRLVTGIIEGTAYEDRAAAAAWPLPIDDREPAPEAYGGWGSPTYDRMAVDYLRACVEHFLQRGWLDRAFVWMPLPGPTDADRYKQTEHFGRIVRQADTRIRLVCNLPPQPMAPYGYRNEPFINLRDYAGIWCPPASLMDPQAISREAAAGRPGWLWPDQPPYAGSLAVYAPPADAPSIPWQAYRYRLSGVLLASIDAWRDDGVAVAAGSERALIWPGKAYGLNGPIPSIRLKRLLRGAQDYEYLWLLEHNRRPGIAKLIAQDLFSYGGTDACGDHLLDGRAHGWVQDQAAWGLARRLMARELTVALAESETAAAAAEDVSAFAQQLEWSRLAATVRELRTCVEGVRMQLDGQNADAPLRIEATISLYNGTRKLLTAVPAFVQLPGGWSTPESGESIKNLEPLHTARRVVRARAATVPVNNDGAMTVSISPTGQKDDPAPITGRLCAITAQRLEHPITLDGKLDDWPLGLNNVASDFVLVGTTEVPKQRRFSPDRPTLPTIVFAGHDTQNLYIAFNCQDDRLQERRMTRSNTMLYDGLWPTGEDCIEIVLDPTGQAIDPGQACHIIVKANGAVITERGATCLERVAPSTPWVSGVTAAIDDQSQPNRWTAEVKIPLASLGKLAPIWGINFARFNPRLAEYSAWTTPRSYLYNPVTFGNIQLGR